MCIITCFGIRVIYSLLDDMEVCKKVLVILYTPKYNRKIKAGSNALIHQTGDIDNTEEIFNSIAMPIHSKLLNDK